MKADEGEVPGQLVRLEGSDLRPVGDHERDLALAKQRHHVGCEPALVAELDRMTQRRRKDGECGREALVVAPERRRQLPEKRSQLRGA